MPTSLLLPGRTVEMLQPWPISVAVIVDATTGTDKSGPQYAIRLLNGEQKVAGADQVRPVNPDRPDLAHDELVVATLGKRLATRDGKLDGYENGHNNGRTVYNELARDMLRDIDTAAFTAKHQPCAYTAERGADVVGCAFYVDGPTTLYCGVHLPMITTGTRPSTTSREAATVVESPVPSILAQHLDNEPALASAVRDGRIALGTGPEYLNGESA